MLIIPVGGVIGESAVGAELGSLGRKNDGTNTGALMFGTNAAAFTFRALRLNCKASFSIFFLVAYDLRKETVK